MPEERTIGRGGSVGKKPGQAFDGVTPFVRVVRPDQDAKQTRLDLTHSQILAYRRTVNALDTCLPPGPQSLRVAAWAGLTDSMPRAALLSIHARVAGTQASALEDPSLVQLWGPRFSAYVVAAPDAAVFTLGRLPDDGPKRRMIEETAARLAAFLDGRRMSYGEAGHELGVDPNSLRYAAPTGTVRIRWDGARQPTIWTVPPPDMDPGEARLELARRHLHVFGPTTAAAFAGWAGIRPPRNEAIFAALRDSLVAVRMPVGEAWILASDEPAFRAPAGSPDGARSDEATASVSGGVPRTGPVTAGSAGAGTLAWVSCTAFCAGCRRLSDSTPATMHAMITTNPTESVVVFIFIIPSLFHPKFYRQERHQTQNHEKLI